MAAPEEDTALATTIDTQIERKSAPSASAKVRRPLAPALQTGEEVAGRYRVEGLLGRGGMAEVYQVVDRRDGRPLALKLHRIDTTSDTARAALTGEFSLLATLSHPGLASVHDFGYAADGTAFFTQDLVEGLRPTELGLRLDTPRAVGLLAALCRALDYLHARGILHRDIKPSNVLVDSATDRLTLLDFGVAHAFGASGDRVAGTPSYLAPEAIAGAPIDGRADLYSLGVMLYELATGAPPFRGGSTEVMRQHIEEPPPPLPPGALPAPLAAVIARLLEKLPGHRYASAGEVIAAIGEATGVAVEVDTRETLASFVLSARVVGRAGAIDALGTAARGAGSAAPVLLLGDAGTGKSRLLRETRRRCQLASISFLTVQTDRGDGGASLLPEIARLVLTHDVVEALDPAERIELARAIPELRRPRERIAIAIDPDRARTARLDALARAIGLRFATQGAVLAVDDVHWCTPETLRLVADLVLAVRARNARCLFVLSSRPGPAADALAERLEPDRIEATRLGREECRELVESMFGDPDVLAGTPLGDAVAGGEHDALWLQESLRLALETRALVRSGGRFNVAGAPLASPIGELLARRVQVLAKGARRVALATAVLGRPESAVDIAAVSGRAVDAIAGPLGELVRAGLLEGRRDADGRTVYAMHDRYVDAVLASERPAEIVAAHRRAARRLLRGTRARDYRLLERAAGHLAAANTPGAARLLGRAADLARDAGRPDLAAALLGRQAERLLAEGAPVPLELLLGRHDLAFQAGLRDLAASLLDELGSRESGATPAERFQIAIRRARSALAAHAPDRVRGACREALALAAEHGLDDVVHRAMLYAGEAERLFGDMRKAFELLRETASRAADRRDRLTEALALRAASYASYHLGDNTLTAPLAERAVRASRASGDRSLESESLRQLSGAFREQGEMVQARRTLYRAIRVARESGSPEHEAKALNNLGPVEQWLGDIDAALEALGRAIDLKRRMGLGGAELITLNNLSSLLLAAGRLADARRELTAILAAPLESLHVLVIPATTNLGEIELLEGNPDAAEALFEQAAGRARDASVPRFAAHALGSLVRAHLLRGRLDRAAALMPSLEAAAGTTKLHRVRFLCAAALCADAAGDTERALALARSALDERHLAAAVYGAFGGRVEVRWLAAHLLQRTGRSKAARRAAAAARRELDAIAATVRDPEHRRLFLDALPLHRAVVRGVLAAPPGSTW